MSDLTTNLRALATNLRAQAMEADARGEQEAARTLNEQAMTCDQAATRIETGEATRLIEKSLTYANTPLGWQAAVRDVRAAARWLKGEKA